MPVHLFGRPAPLAELAALGLPLIEDAAQAFGAAGRRARPASPRPSASSRRRTCSRSATAGSSPRPTTSSPSGCGCCASTARATRRLRARRLQLAPRRAPGRGAPALPAAPRRAGTRRGARRPRATRSSASASSCELPADEPGHVYHMYVVRSPERDRIARGARRRPGSRRAVVLRDAAPPPARAALPRLRAGLAARDRARRRARTSRCRCGPGSTRDAAGARRRRPSATRRVGVPRVMSSPGQPAPALAARRRRRRSSPPPGTSPSGSASTRDASRATTRRSSTGTIVVARRRRSSSPSSSLFGFYNRWWRYVSTRDMWGVARGVTRRVPRRELRRLRLLDRRTRRGCRAAIAIIDWLLLLAFVAGVAPARAHAHRAPGGAARSSRAARRCSSSAPATRAS